MILLALAVGVCGVGLGKAASDAGMGMTAVLGIAAGTAVVFAIGEGMRRSPEFSSAAVVGPAMGTAAGIATAVGWLDPLADVLGVSPMWGHAVAGVIWFVTLSAALLGGGD